MIGSKLPSVKKQRTKGNFSVRQKINPRLFPKLEFNYLTKFCHLEWKKLSEICRVAKFESLKIIVM